MRRVIALVQLLARAPLVDPDHGHADGPRRLADRQAQVAVVGVHVALLLRRDDDLHHGRQDAVFELAGLEFPEQGGHVGAGLEVGAGGLLALVGFLDGGGAGGEGAGPFG